MSTLQHNLPQFANTIESQWTPPHRNTPSSDQETHHARLGNNLQPQCKRARCSKLLHNKATNAPHLGHYYTVPQKMEFSFHVTTTKLANEGEVNPTMVKGNSHRKRLRTSVPSKHSNLLWNIHAPNPS